MKKLFPCLILILFFQNTIYSQIDSLKNSDSIIPISNQEIITKYRNLLMDNVIMDNKVNGKKYFYELIMKFDNDYYQPLYPSEKLIVCLWLGEYDFLLSDIVNMDSIQLSHMKNKVKPNDDQLYKVLTHYLQKNSQAISDHLSNSDLKLEDKDFYKLLLEIYLTPNGDKFQEKINNEADIYLNKYPESKFENYIRNYIRYEYSKSGFSFGIDLYTGGNIMNAKTSDYFKSGGVFEIGLIWGIGKFQINTRFSTIFSELNKDISVKNYIWQKGESVQIYVPEITVGYNFLSDKRRTSLYPVIGVCWFSAIPPQEDQKKNSELKYIEIDSKVCPMVGIDFGWEFFKRSYFNYAYNKQMFSFYSCNFRYTIQPIYFSTTYNGMNGLMHSLTIGIKFGFGGMKRDY